jgi:hypothetical protein
VGKSFESLKTEEQILRYRQLASEALAMAGATTDKGVQAAYLVMASDWHMLAAELQHDLEAAELEDMPPDDSASDDVSSEGLDSKTSNLRGHRR